MKKIKGTTHTPADWWSEIVTKYGKLLPRQPRELVRVAITPHPPHLPAQGEKLALAVLVARGYFSACMAAYGSCYALRAPDEASVRGSGHLAAFADAIPTLREYHLAPAAWSSFSIEVWQEYVVGGKGGAWDSIPSKRRGPSSRSQPKPRWVFSEKRLSERTGWFDWSRSKYAGGRVIFTPALTKLVVLTHNVKQRLLAEAGSLTEDKVHLIVEGVLPRARRASLVEQANDEAEERMTALRKRMKRGEWIW